MKWMIGISIFLLNGYLVAGEIDYLDYSSNDLNKLWKTFNFDESDLNRMFNSFSEMESFYIEKNGTPSYVCESDDSYCFIDDSSSDDQKIVVQEEYSYLKGIDLNTKIYSIHPIDQNIEYLLKKRLAYLDIYLSREHSFKSTAMDSQESLNQMEQRRNSAYLELFMIHLRNYFSFSDLVQKCEQITAADNIYSTYMKLEERQIINDNNILSTHQSLLNLYNNLLSSKDFALKLNEKSVCNMNLKKDYQSIRVKISVKVQAKIREYIQDKVKEYSILFSGPQKEMFNYIKQIDEDKDSLKIAEIFKLEEALNRVSANLSQLINDDFNLARDPDSSLLVQLRGPKKELELVRKSDEQRNKDILMANMESQEITSSLLLAKKLREKYETMTQEMRSLGVRYSIASCQNLLSPENCFRQIKKKVDDLKNRDKALSSFRGKFSNAMLELTNQMKQGL